MSYDYYLNDDQLDYARYLRSMPREKLCACGWYHKGECRHPGCVKAYEDEQKREK